MIAIALQINLWWCVCHVRYWKSCPQKIKIEGRKVPYFLANGGYTMLFNLIGNPVVIIPIGQTANGLPIGMQIIGKRWREMELLAIAEEINKVAGEFQHPSL